MAVNSPDPVPSLTYGERTELMLDLCEVVRRIGEYILAVESDDIYDTIEVARHQYSTLDQKAASKMRAVITDVLGKFPGLVLEESEIPQALAGEKISYPLLIGDALEGSTNAKRGRAASAMLRRPVLAGVSVMVLENESLQSIAASAFFDFSSRKVFSSKRGEAGSFDAYVDGMLLRPRDPNILECCGDTQTYVIVPGYSHDNVEERAAVERALLSRGFRTQGGTRSSAQDLVEILCNQADGYADLRCLFSGSTESRDEVLHSWDVGGILPVLDGLGFVIIDASTNQGWQKRSFSDALALVVTRPSLQANMQAAMSSLPFFSHTDSNKSTVLPLVRQI